MSTRHNGNYFHFVTFLAINSKNNKGFIRTFLHLQTHWAVSCKPWTLAELLWLLQTRKGRYTDRQTYSCQILMSVRPWANTLVIWVFTHNTTQCQHLVSRLHRARRTHIVHSTNRTTHVSTSILENTATTCDISMSFWVLRLTRCCVFFAIFPIGLRTV